MFPFSKQELNNFKEKKIKRVTSKSNDYETVYFFNSQGQLHKEYSYNIYKKKKKLLDSVIYKYDNMGNLMLINHMGHFNLYDSIVYNNVGRVIYFLSYETYKQKNKKPEIEMRYELVLERSDNNISIFIDKADSLYNTRFVYNANNEIIKKYSSYSRDSLAKTDISTTEYSVKYFYKEDTAKYKLGQEFIYKNNKLSVCTFYDKYYIDVLLGYQTIRYYYNDAGALILKTTGDHNYGTKEVYFYDHKGFLYQVYVLYDNTLKDYCYYNYSLYD